MRDLRHLRLYDGPEKSGDLLQQSDVATFLTALQAVRDLHPAELQGDIAVCAHCTTLEQYVEWPCETRTAASLPDEDAPVPDLPCPDGYVWKFGPHAPAGLRAVLPNPLPQDFIDATSHWKRTKS